MLSCPQNVVVKFELVTYDGTPRARHDTVSQMASAEEDIYTLPTYAHMALQASREYLWPDAPSELL